MKASAWIPIGWALLLIALAGCGAGRARETDPYFLLSEGRYEEARAVALAAGTEKAVNRAVVALTYVALSPTRASGQDAVLGLVKGASDRGAVEAAMEMLELVFEIPHPVAPEVSLVLAEVALAGAGQGPLTLSEGNRVAVDATTGELAVGVLERVENALSSPLLSSAIDTNRILVIWNACFLLSGGSFEATSQVQGWRLFKSVAGIAIAISNAAPNSELSKVLLEATVHVLTVNPDLAIPARCDLGSPYDALKLAMAHYREILGQLEAAVTTATGCTRGTYAPQIR